MALKFLNKKGWHTGSLRNIENVWKAEQKHEAEQKKLEELRKQIQDEREQSEFRRLQEESGLLPKQERLDFLYDSGLSVRKSSTADGSSGVEFKAFDESVPGNNSSNINNNSNAPPSSSSAKQPSIPGALFEDKPYSSNDAWRKLHSDPLLLIRQREQEAVACVKNNPVQMAVIRKSVEATKEKEKDHDKRKRRKKHSHSKEKHDKHSSSKLLLDSENDSAEGEKRRKSRVHKSSKYDENHNKARLDSDGESSERENQRRGNGYRGSKNRERSPSGFSCPKPAENDGHSRRKHHNKSTNEKCSSNGGTDFDADRKERDNRSSLERRSYNLAEAVRYKGRNVTPKFTEEERAARLQEMKMDAELHEEQRWKRLRKAEEDDAREARRASMLGGRNFLDAAHKSVYGAEKGGSSTIEENVRRRTHYSQRKSETGDGNAFRR